jgi:hypothetical protein
LEEFRRMRYLVTVSNQVQESLAFRRKRVRASKNMARSCSPKTDSPTPSSWAQLRLHHVIRLGSRDWRHPLVAGVSMGTELPDLEDAEGNLFDETGIFREVRAAYSAFGFKPKRSGCRGQSPARVTGSRGSSPWAWLLEAKKGFRGRIIGNRGDLFREVARRKVTRAIDVRATRLQTKTVKLTVVLGMISRNRGR